LAAHLGESLLKITGNEVSGKALETIKEKIRAHPEDKI